MKRNPEYLTRFLSPIDILATFETIARNGQPTASPSRYAVRQVLDQEYQKYILRQSAEMRQARYNAGGINGQPSSTQTVRGLVQSETDGMKTLKPSQVRRDFFGRIIQDGDGGLLMKQAKNSASVREGNEVWVSFHEGFSNAVRKPITMEELMKGV